MMNVLLLKATKTLQFFAVSVCAAVSVIVAPVTSGSCLNFSVIVELDAVKLTENALPKMDAEAYGLLLENWQNVRVYPPDCRSAARSVVLVDRSVAASWVVTPKIWD